MQSYVNQINELSSVSFDAIKNIAKQEIKKLDSKLKEVLYNQLNRGVSVLNTEQQLQQYLFSFGDMHKAKLLTAFEKLPIGFFEKPFRIVDWGCGQAVGTINLIDYIQNYNLKTHVKEIVLIEPSNKALEYAELYVKSYFKDTNSPVRIKCINEYFESIDASELADDNFLPTIHIFSNILDVSAIDLKKLATLVDSSIVEDSYLVCVGPLNPNNNRLDHFFNYFNKEEIENVYELVDYHFGENFNNKNWTNKTKIYKLRRNAEGHLLPLEYYPTVMFSGAYELDCIRTIKHNMTIEDRLSLTKYNSFNSAALFDIGASCYDNIHSILAVLHNIIVRGLPTKISPFLEKQFSEAFKLTSKTLNSWELNYPLNNDVDINLLDLINRYELNEKMKSSELDFIELYASPIAIARFHKVLIEVLISNKLSFKDKEWNILIEEKDVSFAWLAIEDFKQIFAALTRISSEYDILELPHINVTVINNSEFRYSSLQKANKVVFDPGNSEFSKHYDLVYTHSFFNSLRSDLDRFTKFKAKNECYFNVISIQEVSINRHIYTSDLVLYKKVVEKAENGSYNIIEDVKLNLEYFVQLLFRKVTFRPGQLPILDRALQMKPVIGLLPTGGGKSLTYQIAAFLQPGITMVIDPLKSLMVDQVEGLLENGIDSIAFINSSQTAGEKRIVENSLESSQLQIVFVSPERLAIHEFRTRLANMYSYNVYFAYGVIDEVHCVSEWGHDFRFSYLHLGRNLYTYVKAKDREISLFGLTATASFDVLADVERELSGNGAFELDTDTVVRYENTNRLELQYKIEKIPIKFYEVKINVGKDFPNAVNLENTKDLAISKYDFLKSYLGQIPSYINEIQSVDNIEKIKANFEDRQGNTVGLEQDITTDIPFDYYKKQKVYNQSGIIFCPHVKTTFLSVEKNKANLRSLVSDIASFSGQDKDNDAIFSLKNFKQNKSPLMVATKAFGMGIDKPNVRFTINMNYSSSLESFVQEAGRSGRDKKMALAIILVSDYELYQLQHNYDSNNAEIVSIRGKWFQGQDLHLIIKALGLDIPKEYILKATPENDVAKLGCSIDSAMFREVRCNNQCPSFKGCELKKVPRLYRNTWWSESELEAKLKLENIKLPKKHLVYLNPDYNAIMYFYNQSFKGDKVEKMFLHNLLSKSELTIVEKQVQESRSQGFLQSVVDSDINQEVIVYVPYKEANKDLKEEGDYVDLCKAIYRMCCIDLIEDFTQDYKNKQFRIVAKRKKEGEYFEGLRRFLLRYYSEERAKGEVETSKELWVDKSINEGVSREIYQCLSYLTSFVYEKISEKRKRAMDDMRSFCLEGVQKDVSWIDKNEALKDYLFFYFNSKYAKPDYLTDGGVPYSLVTDTEEGKISEKWILEKYLKVIDDKIVGTGTPLDNIRHLYGAVRLVSRSLTDSNPALYLLDAFCIAYLGIKRNENLKNQFIKRYTEGMVGFSDRSNSQKEFWSLFEEYNREIVKYIDVKLLDGLNKDLMIQLHGEQVKLLMRQYLK